MLERSPPRSTPLWANGTKREQSSQGLLTAVSTVTTLKKVVTAKMEKTPANREVYPTTAATVQSAARPFHQLKHRVFVTLSSRGTGNYLTISDISDLVIAPPPSSWFAGSNGTGSGAPREHGTGLAFGFNWIMGAANPIPGSPSDGYSQFTAYNLSGISVVPAPGALALLGVAGLVGGRRRRA